MSLSKKLQITLANKQALTLKDIIEVFADKSFALLCLVLMSVPALPLPTGGVTHVFEIITALLALELIAGRDDVWLPRRWLKANLPKSIQGTALPKFVNFVSWVEKYTKPRLAGLMKNNLAVRVIGMAILILTVFAFLAPPFSGLDTLPALGVVFISLALIFDDVILLVAGLAIGSIGIAVILALGNMVLKLF